MTIARTMAADLIEQARLGRLSIHFRLDDDHDHCIIDVEWHGTTVGLSKQWFTTDCVGPKHDGIDELELREPEAIDWLAEAVRAPFEINQRPPQTL